MTEQSIAERLAQFDRGSVAKFLEKGGEGCQTVERRRGSCAGARKTGEGTVGLIVGEVCDLLSQLIDPSGGSTLMRRFSDTAAQRCKLSPLSLCSYEIGRLHPGPMSLRTLALMRWTA